MVECLRRGSCWLWKVVIYAFQLFLYSGIIFFKIIFKHRINIIRLFIYVIIIISLLLVFELDDRLTYSMLFLQSSRYKNPLSKGPKMDMPQVYWRFDQQNNTTWT